MPKNLPIKVFEKRKEDDRKTEGGGSKNLPDWFLSGKELDEQVRYLHSIISGLNEIFDEKNSIGDFLPTVVSTNLIDNAIAKSHRGKVSQIFNVSEKNNVIGFGEDNTLLIKIDNREDLDLIGKNIRKVDKHAFGISAIEEIKLFEPIIELSLGNPLKIELFNYYNYDLNNLVKKRFIDLCDENQIKYNEARYTENSIIFKVKEYEDEHLELIKNFSGIHSVTNMPSFGALYNDQGEEITVNIKVPDKDDFYPTVGVLDTGISKIPHLDPWIDATETFYIEDEIDRNHGTFVSGVLLYGDILEDSHYTGTTGCKLFDATVFPKGLTVLEDELLDNIRDVIEKYPSIYIWHLSLGGVNEISVNYISHFGAALDELQSNYNILIIKSAGNCDNYKRNAVRRRLFGGSDSVNSIVVGSIAHKKRENDLAEIDYPSPFSVSGFALSNIVKPDLTHYGGNAGSHNSVTGVNSFNESGAFVSSIGTSFSAPRVTALAAELYKKIGAEFDPLLIKALLIHSAKYPENVNMDLEDRLKLMGFGVPSNINDILYNDPHEITLILSDSIEKGNFIEILDFPFPDEMQENGRYYGELFVTLVTSPILDENQGPEYCQSNIDIFLGTFDDLVERDGKTIRNPVGRNMSINFLNNSIFSTRKQKHNSEFTRERLLIDYYKKYQPVKKWVINLEEFKNSPSDRFLAAPKRWYLKLNGLYRDFTETRYPELTQDFCLILTIRDNKKRHNIYQTVSTQLNQRNFVNSNVQLREQVVIRTKS